jgi:hypothetical protein
MLHFVSSVSMPASGTPGKNNKKINKSKDSSREDWYIKGKWRKSPYRDNFFFHLTKRVCIQRQDSDVIVCAECGLNCCAIRLCRISLTVCSGRIFWFVNFSKIVTRLSKRLAILDSSESELHSIIEIIAISGRW